MQKNTFVQGIWNARFWQTLTILWVILIFILCLVPASDLPQAEGIPNLDKIVHFTFYFTLIISSLITIKLLQKSVASILIVTGCFAMSFLIECLQAILPFNRSFSGYDLIANLTGLVCGWLVFFFIIKKSTRLI